MQYACCVWKAYWYGHGFLLTSLIGVPLVQWLTIHSVLNVTNWALALLILTLHFAAQNIGHIKLY